VEKGVLNDGKLDSLVEAIATEVGCLLGIQALDVHDVEVGILSHVGLDGLDNLCFQFLFHFTFLLQIIQR